MSNIIDLIRFVMKEIYKPFLQMLLIIGTLLYIQRDWLTITLTILLWSWVFKLFVDIKDGWHPDFKEYFKSSLVTIVFVQFFYWLVYFTGGAGLFVTIVLLLGFASWRIYEGWALFDLVTTWGAERLKGKHKKPFDVNKIKEETKK